jgi:glycosyltransferase involved in cell wall biosynthesis
MRPNGGYRLSITNISLFIESNRMNQPLKLGIVVPCFNEEEVLPETSRRLTSLIIRLADSGKISRDSQVYFVDDGSRDNTWQLVEQLSAESRNVAGIKLSRNRGHQNALLAGLFNAEGDAIVSIDADLQDDVDAIEAMVDQFHFGAEVIYGVRKRRDSDTFFKRATAEGFYKLIAALGAESVYNHADYRLMSRRAIECLKQYDEVNLFLRGIVPLIGFKSEIVYYDRTNRFAGESKYPLRKMLALALDAVTSFSVVPLRLITIGGFVIFAGSMMVSAWALGVRLFTNDTVPGWTSIVLPMYFLGGIQIFCIGMLGEYLGKTYAEVKARPRFFIERMTARYVIASAGNTHLNANE